MEITSWAFVGFVAFALAVFHSLRGVTRSYWLLGTSYAFYATWAWQFPAALAGLTLATWCLGRRPTPLRVGIGVLGAVGSLALLRWGHGSTLRIGLEILLPVGFAFQILGAIAYLVDRSRGQARPLDLPTYALFLGYFPKLLSGPVMRSEEFVRAVERPHVIGEPTLRRAGGLILLGLFRKLVIGDGLASLAPVREVWISPSASVVALTVLAQGVRLYQDLAGYTDVARGVSLLFGIEMPPNFAYPLFARSHREFWERWHITFTQWLRSYVYFPVSRALLRRPRTRRIGSRSLPDLLTFLASGWWHGGTAGSIVWGLTSGVYVVAERFRSGATPSGSRSRAGLLLLYIAGGVAFLPLLVRIDAAAGAWILLATPTAWHLPDPRPWIVLVPIYLLEWWQMKRRDDLFFLAWPQPARAVLLAGAVLAMFLATREAPPLPFVYQGF